LDLKRSTGLVLVGALLLTLVASGTALAEGDGVPSVRAQTEWDRIWLTDWPAGTQITVVVDTDWSYDLNDESTYLYSGTATADSAGEAAIQFNHDELDLRPGHHVTAIGGAITKQILVPELTVFTNSETGEVFGTIGIPDPVGDIGVYVSPGSSGEVFRHVAASATWTVNLATPPANADDTGQMSLPLPDGLQGSLLFTDADDDAAEIPWYIAWRGVFRDDDNSVFEQPIDWLALSGITHGCNPPVNDRFCPDAYVTRGQMAAFLHRALGDVLTPSEPVQFVDDDGSTFEADIEWLGSTGVTRGCNPPVNDRYCPSDNVTRGQMAAFLVRAFGYTDDGGGNLFIDDDGTTFETDIDKLATAEVTYGCNPPANTEYCPNGFVTRGQMAAFLQRALDK
jgi:hypothetical protein